MWPLRVVLAIPPGGPRDGFHVPEQLLSIDSTAFKTEWSPVVMSLSYE